MQIMQFSMHGVGKTAFEEHKFLHYCMLPGVCRVIAGDRFSTSRSRSLWKVPGVPDKATLRSLQLGSPLLPLWLAVSVRDPVGILPYYTLCGGFAEDQSSLVSRVHASSLS
jgi:hypothetical protein